MTTNDIDGREGQTSAGTGGVSRRDFLKGSGLMLGGVLAGPFAGPILHNLSTPLGVDNPLAFYPNRGWERVYRDQYHYDDTFTFVCAPIERLPRSVTTRPV